MLLAGTITHEMCGNPYWEFLVDVLGHTPFLNLDPALRLDHPQLCGQPLRSFCLSRYAHTITSPRTEYFLHEAMWTLRGVDVVSIGAGTGYLEALLAKIWRVFAFDLYPPNTVANAYHGEFESDGTWQPTPVFHPVNRGGPEMAAHFPNANLLLSWPPPGQLASDALQAYHGNGLIYIGELNNAAQNGSLEFFQALRENWLRVMEHIPLRWKGSNDTIAVFKRRNPIR